MFRLPALRVQHLAVLVAAPCAAAAVYSSGVRPQRRAGLASPAASSSSSTAWLLPGALGALSLAQLCGAASLPLIGAAAGVLLPAPAPPSAGGAWLRAPAREDLDQLEAALRDAFGQPPPPPGASPLPPRRPVPPPQSRYSGGPNEAGRALVHSIMGANLGVYLAFQVPAAQAFMMRWFTCGASALRDGARGALRMLTCTYAHASLLHLGANMMTFYSFAPRVMEGRSSASTPRLGAGEFLALWTASGVLSSLASSAFYARLGSFTPSLGASGSLFAVLTYFCLSFPDTGLLLFFVVPLSAQAALVLASGANVYLVARAVAAARARTPTPMVDGMAHLGGTAVGAAWWLKRSAEEAAAAARGGGGGGGGGARRFREDEARRRDEDAAARRGGIAV